MRRIAGLLLPLVLGFSTAVHAADFPITLHGDLPLAPGPGITYWPQEFETASGPGIGSRLAIGDWRIVPLGCDPAKDEDCVRWMRLTMGSAVHRYYNIGEAYRRTDLHGDDGLIIELSPELPNVYALQIGFVGGSRYILFSTKESKDLVKQAVLLDPRCLDMPGAEFRQSPYQEIHDTGYCAVNSMAALVAIARAAEARPPQATMEWISAPPVDP
ncbi:MAG TPA: hypothetical protein VHZ78_01485 [Rhizomicrobium sp.]|jgi:hypothetical protein|nr:hypothetical protein [Rhizomicrobium sp.]